MNWTAFIVEAVVLCVVFHLVIYLIIRYRPELEVYSYPPAITERWIALGKVPRKEVPGRIERIRKKLPAVLVCTIVLGLIVYFLNGCRTFLTGFLVSYALWLIVDWYDALVMDCLWFCHSGTCVLPGTEDLTDAYHDYMYHIRSSLIGMVLGLPVSLMIGLVVQVISWL